MTLTTGRRRQRILELTDLSCKENSGQIKLDGVEQIRVREHGGAWRTYRVHGRVDFLESCELQGKPGEYEAELDGHSLSVSIGLAHFTPAQVDEMVAALHEQEYRQDATAAGAHKTRLFSALQDDVAAFIPAWQALREVVQAIVACPAERLTLEVQEVGLHRRQRHTASTLAQNLRAGRLTADAQATHEKLYALSDQVSFDTAENSHLRAVVEAYEARRSLLLDRADRQIRSLILELKREEAYQAAPERRRHLDEQLVRVQEMSQDLHTFEEQPLPDSWRRFRHKPSASTNRARFDERYTQVAELEERLDAQRPDGRPRDALERIEECGRRATWQLYEYWLVAKLCEQLVALGFACEQKQGFRALENWQGAAYGLHENASLTFWHPSGLGTRLTYERHVPWTDGQGRTCVLRPDVVLDLLGLDGESISLVLDAKYKNYVPGHDALGRDLNKSARRYGRALGGAMAFLVHPGDKGTAPFEAWPSPTRQLHARPLSLPFSKEDLPLQHGIVGAFPGSAGDISEEVRPLRRILTAWLIKNGIFWVCFSCGKNLKDVGTARMTKLPGEKDLDVSVRHFRYRASDRWPRFASYACPCGGLTGMLTYCGSCGQGGRVWQPIFKYLPVDVRGNVEQAQGSQDWSQAFEIHAVRKGADKQHLRHCSCCGS